MAESRFGRRVVSLVPSWGVRGIVGLVSSWSGARAVDSALLERETGPGLFPFLELETKIWIGPSWNAIRGLG